MAFAPSMRKRQLAEQLRELRREAALNGKDVADQLGWSASKVSRIEKGRIGVSPEDLERLLDLYEAPHHVAERLRELVPPGRARGWWERYADSLSPRYASLLELEDASVSLRCFCACVPHPLLLTPEYARRILMATAQLLPATAIERRLQVILRRQRRLSADAGRPPLRLSAIIDESLLRRDVLDADGTVDAAVKRGQLERLREVAGWPNVDIRVLPFTAGLPPVTAGAFSIAQSPTDVVYLENKFRISFIDSEAEVHQYSLDFDYLVAMALPPDESVNVIADFMARL